MMEIALTTKKKKKKNHILHYMANIISTIKTN